MGQEDSLRAWSVPREVSPSQAVGGTMGVGGCVIPGGNDDGRPNGWATFVGEVPEPPPPPRTATIRREKKVTILDQAVHRL